MLLGAGLVHSEGREVCAYPAFKDFFFFRYTPLGAGRLYKGSLSCLAKVVKIHLVCV